MAKRTNPNRKAALARGRAATRTVPKIKVIESGKTEQGEPIRSSSERLVDKEREAYRHSGIPIGSDPRE